MGQNISLPVYKGEIQAWNLGMAVDAWNEEGKAVWGDSSKLVCTKPIPCQPTHFWNNENGNKYRKAYFSKFPGIRAHGDCCSINSKTRGVIMLGLRSRLLFPGAPPSGVDSFEEVEDSLYVPQYNKYREERVILFLKTASGHAFQPDLVKRICDAIRMGLSVRHVPSVILETKGIAYTLNGNKVEVAVKQIIARKAMEQRGAFSNPEALHLYWDIPELHGF
uniref:Acetoacetyl-CoA synthetase n=1 Tax=Pan paniscus TaxID=9597 RepID=A0A2R9BM65_PANPA